MKIPLFLVFASSIFLLMKEVDVSLNTVPYLNIRNLTRRQTMQSYYNNLSNSKLNGSNDNLIKYVMMNKNSMPMGLNNLTDYTSYKYNLSQLDSIFQESLKYCKLNKISDMLLLTVEQQKLTRKCIIEHIRQQIYPLTDKIYLSNDSDVNALESNVNYDYNTTAFADVYSLKMDNDTDFYLRDYNHQSPKYQKTRTNYDCHHKKNNQKCSDGQYADENEGILIFMNFTKKSRDPTKTVDPFKILEKIVKSLPIKPGEGKPNVIRTSEEFADMK